VWLPSKNANAENPCKPFGVAQIPQNFRNRFASDLHRAIGDYDMDRRVGIPYIEFRIEQPEFFRIVANWSYDDARVSRFADCRFLHPTAYAAADGAFVVE
jgi:hypothetical protein